MGEDKFNLQWKAYETHVRTAFVDMYNNNSFSDVTLVSDDQKPFQAHKVMLSACSPVLRNIRPISKYAMCQKRSIV